MICTTCKKALLPIQAQVLDEDSDLIFCDEKCLNVFFSKVIDTFEKEHETLRSEHDFDFRKEPRFEEVLSELLSHPDEIWEEDIELEDQSMISLHFYLGEFSKADLGHFYYVGVVYLVDDAPKFVLFHFPTADEKLVRSYRRGIKIFSNTESEQGEDLPESEMSEWDDFVDDFHEYILSKRDDSDIDVDEFAEYENFKTPTFSSPKEIWEVEDSDGNVFRILLKEFDHEGQKIFYCAVASQIGAHDRFQIEFGVPSINPQFFESVRFGQKI